MSTILLLKGSSIIECSVSNKRQVLMSIMKSRLEHNKVSVFGYILLLLMLSAFYSLVVVGKTKQSATLFIVRLFDVGQ